MTMLQLFAVDPPSERFRANQEGELRKKLDDIHSHTVFEQIETAREVTLDPQGRTLAGNYQLTTWAFYQLCNAVCPGMYRFIVELSGKNRRADQPRQDYSFEEALAVFNRTVQRRFRSRVEGRQIIRNTRTHLIDGIVGPKYRFLPNLELFEQARDLLTTEIGDLEFYEAVLNGRWLLLRFYRRTALFTLPVPDGVPVPDRFFGGFHFSNSEVGQSAAKAGIMLLRDIGRTASISPLVSSSRLRHAGKGFEEKLALAIASTTEKLLPAEQYRQRLLMLQAMPLGLGNEDQHVEEQRREDLVTALVRRRMNPGIARRILGHAMCRGSYDSARVSLARVSPATMKQRDAFDLYNAIGREAKVHAINQRERAEQIAYALLLGRFRIPK